ncbi:MAG: hypothetical protein RR229_00760 [Oscillospiraceae bacterium]
MSKLKKDRPIDLLYSIVTALMAVLIPVAAYFGNFLHIIVNSPIFAWMGQAQGNKQDKGDTLTLWSVNRFVKDILPKLNFGEGSTDKSAFWQTIAPIKVALICTIVFLALALIISIAVFVLAWFSKLKKTTLLVATGGIVSLLSAIISFNFVVIPLTNGTITLGAFFSDFLGLMMSSIANLTLIKFSTGYYIMLFLFIGIVLWIGSYLLIELGEKEKRQTINN